MISYTAIKKRFTVGTKVQAEHHKRAEVSGPRVVTKQQTNAIVFQPLDRPQAKGGWWVHWPKAGQARVLSDSSVLLMDGEGKTLVTYQIVEED